VSFGAYLCFWLLCALLFIDRCAYRDVLQLLFVACGVAGLRVLGVREVCVVWFWNGFVVVSAVSIGIPILGDVDVF